MRWQEIYIAGLGSRFPDRVETAEEAIAAGRYTARDRDTSGFRAVRVADDGEPGPVLAARAGRLALERSGLRGEEISLVLHAYAAHQGRDIWSPASYVEMAVLSSGAPAYEIRQGCNGGLSALELAASHLTARPDARAALITTGDAFHLPYLDRWNTDDQMVYGDAGAALVLSTRPGPLRLLATASVGDSSLEILDRGPGPWTRAPLEGGAPVDLAARKRDYFDAEENEFAFEEVLARLRKGSEQAVGRALADAGTELSAIRWCVHTTFPGPVAQSAVYGPLGFSREATTYDWALEHGQLGAGDQIAGLDHLVRSGSPRPGDLVLLYGVGAGHVWTVAVLEFTAEGQTQP
ncbi:MULTISPECIES: ketoacyl-ACP synthase III family protein [Streptomyces]|uniref:ketoacyl-ACP synthase III family protein n=1 Tax=Streptomyces TaxID=1883 RepID=UPI001D1341F2|nr:MULTISPECIES: ketoacyl-ACP synthase III family protein [Streptomyces]MCC3653760.1 ketoacyl-ACP synthase III family protein [Streptomyces sp. S07_1.15]WSQ71713.1 ketoacyl-ACP synthase III family protein [Streptomyces xinghaiensis]